MASPLAWKEKIELKLNDIIELRIVKRVDGSDWCTPLVSILEENGDIQTYGNYKFTTNKYLADF